ncbi:hypothetical protein BJA5080_05183 [Bradyrhizobium diazoefficiens SEMIA 5080]|uniref:Uncharacterized protein n=1 Tax=Bradyrhizobium diazoefficiens SEMIA 5080 TaxID=754504 RepID=A0A837C2W3_9BRAD|nr:hypothetical protein BJA5080_05183 [Bradyrhizobium diazoefficiens SEMIA 5080]
MSNVQDAHAAGGEGGSTPSSATPLRTSSDSIASKMDSTGASHTVTQQMMQSRASNSPDVMRGPSGWPHAAPARVRRRRARAPRRAPKW